MHRDEILTILSKVLLCITVHIIAGPILWGIIVSFQSSRQLASQYLHLLPGTEPLANYAQVLADPAWHTAYINSLLIAGASTLINVLISAPAAYSLCCVRFPSNRLISVVMLVLLFMPAILIAVPLKILFASWGMSGSLWAVILPLSAHLFSVETLWRFYRAMPLEIEYNAVIMGLSPFQTFRHIYLPISGKMIFYAAVMQFIITWNCAALPMYLYAGTDTSVVPNVLLAYTQNGAFGTTMAAVVLFSLPCWILSLLQEKVTK